MVFCYKPWPIFISYNHYEIFQYHSPAWKSCNTDCKFLAFSFSLFNCSIAPSPSPLTTSNSLLTSPHSTLASSTIADSLSQLLFHSSLSSLVCSNWFWRSRTSRSWWRFSCAESWIRERRASYLVLADSSSELEVCSSDCRRARVEERSSRSEVSWLMSCSWRSSSSWCRQHYCTQ